MFELSVDQQKALVTLLKWFVDAENTRKKNKVSYSQSDYKSYITLGGYAGTGKTTLISYFRKELHSKNPKLKVIFCSYTGKATRVLKTKIMEAGGHLSQDTIGTIHSLIYSPMLDDKGEIIGWDKKKEIDGDLIILDEASMVDSEIWSDLQRYGLPIIAVGDHGQLPPIRGSFNLMENPDLKLEKIHRQAEENPIIQLSILARENGEIPDGFYSDRVMKLSRGSSDSQEIIGELLRNFKKDTLVLCGYNTTRIKTNKFIRQVLEFESEDPQSKDRVICLRNNHKKGVFNGMLGTITEISKDDKYSILDVSINMDGEDKIYKGSISADQFNKLPEDKFSFKDNTELTLGEGFEGKTQPKKRTYSDYNSKSGVDLFDFGYAITVHKAQGSQARRVVLFQERFKQMDNASWKRWLYTAVTRAEEELFIVG